MFDAEVEELYLSFFLWLDIPINNNNNKKKLCCLDADQLLLN